MKYLFVNGSPHKGNTWKLAEYAAECIQKEDKEAKFEEIHLMQLGLPFCTGCSNCFRRGPEYCPHKDKMEHVLEAMEAADGVIIACTTFNLRETGLLKNLIDHLCYMLHRPEFYTKKALFLTTVGGIGSRGAVKSVTASLRGIGFNYCYSYACRSLSWNAYVMTEKQRNQLRQVTSRFLRDVQSKKYHCPGSDVLIPYNLFRGMCQYYVPGSEYATEDGIYWTNESRVKRAYDQRIPLHIYQKVIGSFFYFLGRTMGKKIIVTYKK